MTKEIKPGDTFKVKVGGVEYDTYITEHGTQRFYENPDHFLLKSAPVSTIVGCEGGPDLNEMNRRYHRKEFSQRDYAEMNMALGYSVCGFCELSAFDDMLVENPLWVDEEWEESHPGEIYFDSTYLTAQLENKKMTLEEVLQILVKQNDITYAEAQKQFIEWIYG